MHVSGEHGEHAGHASDGVRELLVIASCELVGHNAVDVSEHLREFHTLTVVLQHNTQGLNEPGAILVVPPGEVTWEL